MADYDKYYEQEDLFGEPYAELVDFFKKYTPKGSILDVGCGQGRDAIPLAKLGYTVTGIDNSSLGIQQMLAKAERSGIKLTGIVDDVYSFGDYGNYDIVLFDSMFHFYKNDLARESNFIIEVANQIPLNGLMCFCIQDSDSKVNTLKVILKNGCRKFEVLNDSCKRLHKNVG